MEQEIYMNRELSWLKFNERVLEEAENEHVPLAERLSFEAIYQSNLDELDVYKRQPQLHTVFLISAEAVCLFF